MPEALLFIDILPNRFVSLSGRRCRGRFYFACSQSSKGAERPRKLAKNLSSIAKAA
jgi:hypothetical protein